MFTLAIAGRPNVGKSTLFNRLARKKLAIIDDSPGVTRDWRESEGMLFDIPLRIIDTAGLEDRMDDSIEARMRRQTESALKQADAILFMIDGRTGVTPLDRHFAQWLRKQGKPIILGVNKCEGNKASMAGIAEAYALGLGDPIPMSAAHGEGLEDLYGYIRPLIPGGMDEATDLDILNVEDGDLPTDLDSLEGDDNFDFAALARPEEEDQKPIKITIAGRPNVGKSTLLNSLIGEERVMTGPEAGITRDSIAVKWEHKGRILRLVDTAGLRRKARIDDQIEKMATDDSIRAIRLAQVVLLVIDATMGVEKQDLTIASHVIDEGRALVFAFNKWDAVENKQEVLQKLKDRLLASFGQVQDVPFVTLSGLTGSNKDRLLDVAVQTYDIWTRRIKTSKMNRWLADMESRNPAPLVNGRPNRLRYMTQIKTRPPTFALWCSKPDDLPETYKRYLINGLRRDFDMPGIPVRLMLRASKNPYVS